MVPTHLENPESKKEFQAWKNENVLEISLKFLKNTYEIIIKYIS